MMESLGTHLTYLSEYSKHVFQESEKVRCSNVAARGPNNSIHCFPTFTPYPGNDQERRKKKTLLPQLTIS